MTYVIFQSWRSSSLWLIGLTPIRVLQLIAYRVAREDTNA